MLQWRGNCFRLFYAGPLPPKKRRFERKKHVNEDEGGGNHFYFIFCLLAIWGNVLVLCYSCEERKGHSVFGGMRQREQRRGVFREERMIFVSVCSSKLLTLAKKRGESFAHKRRGVWGCGESSVVKRRGGTKYVSFIYHFFPTCDFSFYHLLFFLLFFLIEWILRLRHKKEGVGEFLLKLRHRNFTKKKKKKFVLHQDSQLGCSTARSAPLLLKVALARY